MVALGILVDNTIQVCSNTQSYLDSGLSHRDAATTGPNQIAFSALIASGTILTAFLPMVYSMKGASREYVFSIPVVVSLCIGVGWIYAYTMTVIMTYYGLQKTDPSKTNPIAEKLKSLLPGKKEERSNGNRWTRAAERICRTLPGGHQGEVDHGSRLLHILDRRIFAHGKFGLFPLSDRDQFVVDIWLPEGAPIDRTNQVGKPLQEIIRALGKNI